MLNIKNIPTYFFYFILNIIFFTVITISIYRLICSIEIENFNFSTISISSFSFTESFFLFNFEEHSLSLQYLDVKLIMNINIIDLYLYFFLERLYLYDISINSTSNYIINFHTYYLKVVFFTKLSTLLDSHNFFFFSLQQSLYLIQNETVLSFFRILNKTNSTFDCLTVYLIYPFQYTLFLTKLQCFCFSNLIIQSLESIDMPVLFYFINKNIFEVDKVYFFYLILIK